VKKLEIPRHTPGYAEFGHKVGAIGRFPVDRALTVTILFPVPHRHFTLGIPNMLRPVAVCAVRRPLGLRPAPSSKNPPGIIFPS
jgi:hypothetical protein